METLQTIASLDATKPLNASLQNNHPGHPCPKCGREMAGHPRSPSELSCGTCWRLERREREVREFEAGIEKWAEARCLASGMSPREVRSTLEKIPTPIKRALPVEQVKAMIDGEIPTRGFGLGGEGTGAGKTSAFAAVLLACVRSEALRRVRVAGEDLDSSWITWEAWPRAVGWMRMNAISDQVGPFLDRLIFAQVLFLDDLGSERIKGSYVEDFAASQLDLIVDERYRNERPIFYTTNLDQNGLIEFYGARLVSRLCGDNPLFVIGNLPDQRFPS